MPRVPGPHVPSGTTPSPTGGYGPHDPGGPLAPTGPHGGGTGGGNSGGNGGSGGGGGLNPNQQSAFSILAQILEDAGLGSLTGYLTQLIQSGITDAATLQYMLEQTDQWKRRFAGNEMLKKAGLAVLSPAEYLAMERQYAQIMRNYGLPKGFYDDPTDFATWIGHNVSVNELQQRVAAYSDIANREDPAIVDQLNSMGLSKGDMLAYFMDPERAAPLLQRQYQTALIGGAARRAGMTGADLNNDYLTQLAARGVTEQQASQGYGLIAGSLSDAKTLSAIYGENVGLGDLQAEVFDSNGKASRKRKRLASQERAAFTGTAGVGSLTENSSGNY